MKNVAAEPGFEPGQKDPKSFVLPLHNSATLNGAEGRGRTDTRVAPQQFLRLSRLPVPPLRPDCQAINGAEAQNRTEDTRIFSPLLYLLSYLGTTYNFSFTHPRLSRLTRLRRLRQYHVINQTGAAYPDGKRNQRRGPYFRKLRQCCGVGD